MSPHAREIGDRVWNASASARIRGITSAIGVLEPEFAEQCDFLLRPTSPSFAEQFRAA